jgi:hypothetical protein
MPRRTMGRGNRLRGRIAVLAAVVAAFAVAPLAATAAIYPVWGEQVQVAFDPSTSTSTYTMTGGLVGNWVTVTTGFTYDAATGRFGAWGTESFDGCVDLRRDGCGPFDPHGTLSLTFKAWQQYDPQTGAFISGGCIHPVTGGTGGFERARGVIGMKDTPNADGTVSTTYRGLLSIPSSGVWTKSVGGARDRSLASVSLQPTCGS